MTVSVKAHWISEQEFEDLESSQVADMLDISSMNIVSFWRDDDGILNVEVHTPKEPNPETLSNERYLSDEMLARLQNK